MTAREGIVVLGAPRSGTTLLRRVLDAHPDIACPPETTVLSAAARFLHEHPLDGGVRFGVVQGLAPLGFSEADVLGRLRELVFGFHREHAARSGKPRWAEKTAADVYHLPAIERLCGDHVHYVGMIRHGLDVAVSMKDLTDRSGGALAELQRYLRDEHRPIVAYAQAWLDATEAIFDLAERRPDDITLLRYEDLVADPFAALGPLFERLGARFDHFLLEKATSTGSPGFGDWRTWSRSGIDSASVGRHSSVSKHLRAELAPRLNPTLVRAGYPALQVPKIKAVDPARRMELAMRLGAARDGER